jgi:hypothetical protein
VGVFDNCEGVLVVCVLVFTVFCIVCTVFLYCFVYVYLFLFVLSVLVQGLLPPSENSIAVNDNNNLPRVMKNYSPTGKRNHGRPLKRLLDT